MTAEEALARDRPIETAEYDNFRSTGERNWANPHEYGGPRGRAAEEKDQDKYHGPNPNVTVWKLGSGNEIAALR